MLASLLLYPSMVDSGSLTGLSRRPCVISMSGDLSGRPASSSILRPALERKTIMGAAAAAADDPAFGDQSHLFPACLVLNADFSPLSYVPLSLWSWKDTVRAVFRGSAQVVTEYDEWIVRSPNLDLNLPSVIALKARPFFTPFRRPTHTDYPHLPTHAHTHTFTAHAPWQEYVPTRNTHPPAFTRRNVYLRDSFTCQVRPQHPWAGVLAGRLTLSLNLTPDSDPQPYPRL